MSASEKHDIFTKRLNELRASFSNQLPERIHTIEQNISALLSTTSGESAIINLRQNTHKLAGAGGSFGYHQLSDKARQMEQYVAILIDSNKKTGKRELTAINKIFNEIRDLSIKGADENTLYPTPRPLTVSDTQTETTEHTKSQTNLIFIVEDDPEIADDLSIRLEQFGYKTVVFSDATSAAKAAKQNTPFALLVDVVLPEGLLSGPAFIDAIKVNNPEIPVIFISTRGDWQARLACARAGGAAYLTKPVDTRDLIDRLDSMCGMGQDEPYRVLIVDDVEILARHYSLVLEAAGVETTVVTDVSGLLESLINNKPELILMDLYMPECTGIEAAKVIRQINEYLDVPIVFLSTESEIGQQMEAMKIGGDDFLHKPIRDEHLVAAVTIRAQRFRHLRSVMERDSLTGLINHEVLEHELTRELSRAKRDDTEMVFAMIDIDHFKNINDQYGHQVGDRVLKAMSRYLVQRLRASDIVGRYGGEEFGVILPTTSATQAVTLLNEVKDEISQVMHNYGEKSFNITFSAGIAVYPVYQREDQLIRAADAALYEAKNRGRNRVVVDSASVNQS